MKKSSLLLFLFNLIVVVSFAQRTFIHCGAIIDGKNKQLLQQMTIVVEGNKITSVDNGFTKPGII